MKSESLTIVIPVYNEQDSIETVLTGWHHSLKRENIKHDFVIVNDGSTDDTGNILETLAKKWECLHIYSQENAGHGAAIKYGYSIACNMNNNYIFQTDSDHQFTPADFPKFWKERQEYQAIFGIRHNRQDPPLRKIITGLLQKIVFDIYDTNIPDANIPYRLFRKNYLRNLIAVLPTGAFAPNIFLSILCYKSKAIKTKSIDVVHFDRAHGEAKLIRFGLIKACIQSFIEVFKFSYELNRRLVFVAEKVEQDEYTSNQNNITHSETHLKVA